MTKLHLALLGLAISGISAAPQGIEPRRTDDQYYGPAQFWTEGHYRSSYDGRNGFRLHDIDVRTQKCSIATWRTTKQVQVIDIYTSDPQRTLHENLAPELC
ncbi:hypothetical protein AUP68_07212 [Ilyonectria robusta]